jgi:hypothetical protein
MREQQDLFVKIRTSKDHMFPTRDLFAIALYAACLSVGLHFLEEDCYPDLGIDERKGAEMAEQCWEICHQSLEAADWMQVHNIKSCQAVM